MDKTDDGANVKATPEQTPVEDGHVRFSLGDTFVLKGVWFQLAHVDPEKDAIVLIRCGEKEAERLAAAAHPLNRKDRRQIEKNLLGRNK